MNSTTKMVMVALAACALVACSDHSAGGGAGGWDVGSHSDSGVDAGADVGFDSGGDTGADTDAGTPSYEVSFELQNNSGHPVYASPGVFGTFSCGPTGQDWLTISSQGSPIDPQDSCAVCNCDEAPGCAICDMANCPAPTADIVQLDDGQSRTFQWDARSWLIRPDASAQQSCEQPSSLAGESVQAKFCYGTGFDDTTHQITGVHCQTVDVTIDQPTQVVRVTVPPQAAHDIKFRMINDTGHDVYAYPQADTSSFTCYGSWMSVGDGSTTYTLRAPCGVCDCSQVEQDPTQQCVEACPAAMPCPAPTQDALRLPAGAAREATWDGTITVPDQVAGQDCERHQPPPADELVAKFCWAASTQGTTGATDLADPTCHEVTFNRVDDQTVEYHIQ